MKQLIIGLVLASPLIGMEQAFKLAIKEGNLEKVAQLIAQAQEHSSHHSESNPLLAKSESVNFSKLQEFVDALTPERKARTESRAHAAVYKRILIGGGTMAVSALTLGNYLYQSISTQHWNVQDMCTAIVAGGTAIAHGYKELRLGLQNQDAKDAHAKHLAITHMLLNAQNGNAPYGTL